MPARERRALLPLTLLLLALPRPAAGQEPPAGQVVAAPPSREAARDLYDRGRFQEARAMLDALIQARVVEPEVYYYRGLVEPDADRAAEAWFGEVVRRWPGSEWADRATLQIGLWRYAQGLYITAREKFEQVARRRPAEPMGQEARYWQGMSWTHDPPVPDSLRTGLGFVRQVAETATAPDLLGRALLSAGEISLRLAEPDSALRYARIVVDAPYLEDFLPRAFALQAAACEAKGDMDQARSIWNLVGSRYGDTWEGHQAQLWLAQQREAAVQARIDTLRATGGALFAPGEAGKGQWTVQVGAFSDLAAATRMVVTLTQKGYPAWHTSKRVEGRLLVAVQVGRFETQAEAKAFGQSMKDKGDITEFFPVINP
jgi:TolA-binding protein